MIDYRERPSTVSETRETIQVNVHLVGKLDRWFALPISAGKIREDLRFSKPNDSAWVSDDHCVRRYGDVDQGPGSDQAIFPEFNSWQDRRIGADRYPASDHGLR